MPSSDAIECRVRYWANLIIHDEEPPRYQIGWGASVFDLPAGTTRDEAVSLLKDHDRLLAFVTEQHMGATGNA